ncbi:hypothetical protein AADEFJLK_02695 [Methylovulum psychrotolerans]|uniref:Uncharacterized protein n=1 Tax=Methylovulum psychrotolerans TaxID=1704499 RepID=A0A2S5CK99_9GAMM|nr:hypothetical protein AADEFJLK_02695 [Methylovulum psychrotolerans]
MHRRAQNVMAVNHGLQGAEEIVHRAACREGDDGALQIGGAGCARPQQVVEQDTFL